MTRLLIVLCVFLAGTTSAVADPSRDASRHFQRGVELYNDGDFRGALVEFKKAYEIWPRANVLYDIGQTQYQLLDYAAALGTMSRYLAETGANAAHHTEVEGTVEILRGRVGRVVIVTDGAGCEVSVDEQPSGTAPLIQPLVVSIGLRRIAVACAGRTTASRQVEVAAGDRVEVEIKVPPPTVARVTAGVKPPPVDSRPTRSPLLGGWAVTGLLAAGTIAVGSATLVEESRLNRLKSSYPVTRPTLDHQASLVSGLSVAADVIGAGALVAAAVSTWLTVKYKREQKPRLAWNGAAISF